MMSAADFSRAVPLTFFFSGFYMATFAASGFIFFKVWLRTKNQFFFFFGLACSLLAFERIPLIFLNPSYEENSWVYIFRLMAFIAIMIAIVDANRKKKKMF